MRNKLKIAGVVLVVALMVSAASADEVNVVTNGTFETTATFNSQGFAVLGAGSTDLPGWTIGGNSVDVVGTYWQAAPSGAIRSTSAATAPV